MEVTNTFQSLLDVHWCRRSVIANEIGGLLSNHEDRCIDIAANQVWHH
jgi:hypothetical protein